MKSKKLFLACIGFVCIFLCTSCGAGKGEGSGTSRFLYNGQPADSGLLSGGGYLYDCTKNFPRMCCLEDSAEYDFIRNPFFEENQDVSPIKYIFPGEDFLYYMEDANGGSFRIVQRDYETFSEKTVYSKVYRKNQRELFLGAAKSIPYFSHDFLNSPQPGRFCVFEDVLFLLYNDRVERIDINKKTSVICKKGIDSGNYAYNQGKLFFIGTDYSLYSYHIATDRLETFDGIKASCLLVTPQGIFYANANDGARLYFMDFDSGERRMLADVAVTSMDFSGEQLYYLSVRDDSGFVYSMNFDGSDAQILLDLPESFSLLCVREKQVLYVLYMDSEGELALFLHEISSMNR